MLRPLLYALTARLPARYIDHAGAPYLERYYLATVFGRRWYIHRFVASDPDGLHDHPFLHSFSLLLAGWYWEDRWAGRRRRTWLNRIGPDDFHRVVLPENGRDVWTLFVHSPRVKNWGFLRPVTTVAEGTGPTLYTYSQEASPHDPPFSDWSRYPRGQVLRDTVRRIPLGMNHAAWIAAGASAG